jgi:hypothetical protein
MTTSALRMRNIKWTRAPDSSGETDFLVMTDLGNETAPEVCLN